MRAGEIENVCLPMRNEVSKTVWHAQSIILRKGNIKGIIKSTKVCAFYYVRKLMYTCKILVKICEKYRVFY